MFDGESYVGRHLRKRCSFDRLLCFESVFPVETGTRISTSQTQSTLRGLTATSSPTSIGSSDGPLLKGAEVRSAS
jgi:hypothetical protein